MKISESLPKEELVKEDVATWKTRTKAAEPKFKTSQKVGRIAGGVITAIGGVLAVATVAGIVGAVVGLSFAAAPVVIAVVGVATGVAAIAAIIAGIVGVRLLCKSYWNDPNYVFPRRERALQEMSTENVSYSFALSRYHELIKRGILSKAEIAVVTGLKKSLEEDDLLKVHLIYGDCIYRDAEDLGIKETLRKKALDWIKDHGFSNFTKDYPGLFKYNILKVSDVKENIEEEVKNVTSFNELIVRCGELIFSEKLVSPSHPIIQKLVAEHIMLYPSYEEFVNGHYKHSDIINKYDLIPASVKKINARFKPEYDIEMRKFKQEADHTEKEYADTIRVLNSARDETLAPFRRILELTDQNFKQAERNHQTLVKELRVLRDPGRDVRAIEALNARIHQSSVQLRNAKGEYERANGRFQAHVNAHNHLVSKRQAFEQLDRQHKTLVHSTRKLLSEGCDANRIAVLNERIQKSKAQLDLAKREYDRANAEIKVLGNASKDHVSKRQAFERANQEHQKLALRLQALRVPGRDANRITVLNAKILKSQALLDRAKREYKAAKAEFEVKEREQNILFDKDEKEFRKIRDEKIAEIQNIKKLSLKDYTDKFIEALRQDVQNFVFS